MRESFGAYKLAEVIKQIEWVLAVQLIIAGLYVISPFFIPVPGGSSGALRDALVTRISLNIFAVLYGGSGLTLAYGIWADKQMVRRWGLFAIFCIVNFTVLVQVSTNGLRPLTWLSNLAVGFIAGIIWVHLRGEQKKNGRN